VILFGIFSGGMRVIDKGLYDSVVGFLSYVLNYP
jgi:hypothetical protein